MRMRRRKKGRTRRSEGIGHGVHGADASARRLFRHLPSFFARRRGRLKSVEGLVHRGHRRGQRVIVVRHRLVGKRKTIFSGQSISLIFFCGPLTKVRKKRKS